MYFSLPTWIIFVKYVVKYVDNMWNIFYVLCEEKDHEEEEIGEERSDTKFRFEKRTKSEAHAFITYLFKYVYFSNDWALFKI